MKQLYLVIIALTTAGACGDSSTDTKPQNLESSLQALADEAALEVTDISVPFERLLQAPEHLQTVHRALQEGPAGLYVMRYSDDTLRQTLHVFVIAKDEQVYIKLTIVPGESVAKERFDIQGARYDQAKKALVLETRDGDIRLAPQDVTPVGA